MDPWVPLFFHAQTTGPNDLPNKTLKGSLCRTATILSKTREALLEQRAETRPPKHPSKGSLLPHTPNTFNKIFENVPWTVRYPTRSFVVKGSTFYTGVSSIFLTYQQLLINYSDLKLKCNSSKPKMSKQPASVKRKETAWTLLAT